MLPKSYLLRHYRHSNDQEHNIDSPMTSNLFTAKSFYTAFTKDALRAKREVIIYSPFVSKYRADTLNRLLQSLKDANITVFIFTRPLREYAPSQRNEITEVLGQYEAMGIIVYYLSGYIHEKVAIIDREILWEGSLNILSQRSSREMMRRIASKDSVEQVIRHLQLNDLLAEGQNLGPTQPGQTFSRSTRRKQHLTLRTIIVIWAGLLIAWWLFLAVLDIIPLKVVMILIETLTAY